MNFPSLTSATFFASAAFLGAAADAAAQEGFERHARPFLDQHCVRCHRDGSAESRFLDLSASVTELDLEGGAVDWEWLLERVEFGDMPPPGEAAPDVGEREAFARWPSTSTLPVSTACLARLRVRKKRAAQSQRSRRTESAAAGAVMRGA